MILQTFQNDKSLFIRNTNSILVKPIKLKDEK